MPSYKQLLTIQFIQYYTVRFLSQTQIRKHTHKSHSPPNIHAIFCYKSSTPIHTYTNYKNSVKLYSVRKNYFEYRIFIFPARERCEHRQSTKTLFARSLSFGLSPSSARRTYTYTPQRSRSEQYFLF